MNAKSHAHIDDYGYINARVRAMKSVLLSRDFYEELLHTHEFMSLISLMDKSPYRTEVEECAISKSEMAGVDEALKRNLSRNFRRILNFTAGEPHDLIMLLLGRWDLHNIITLLRGIHIKATPEQIMESLIPAGELDTPFLDQLAHLNSIKEVIDLLATWGSPYAKALIDKFMEYTETKNLSMMELSLYKMYYQHVLEIIKNRSYNCKVLEELISYEIDAINTTTILRLQLADLNDLMEKKIEEEAKKTKNIPKDEISFWEMMTQEEKYGGIIFTKKFHTNIFSRLWKNGFNFLGRKFKKAKGEYNFRNKAENKKDLYGDSFENIKIYSKDDVVKNIEEYFVHGGKEITERKFVKMCLTMDVQKVLKELESTSFGIVLKSVLQRFLEYNTISVLERKIEEMVIKKGINAYHKNSLSIGVPIGYIWKKYNEVVNLRIILRCKKVGMPEKKIREELILV
ncbi:MAG: V-type ATPase subunit [bacterium]|nr:V-type ATPase subunit [bacterium]